MCDVYVNVAPDFEFLIVFVSQLSFVFLFRCLDVSSSCSGPLDLGHLDF